MPSKAAKPDCRSIDTLARGGLTVITIEITGVLHTEHWRPPLTFVRYLFFYSLRERTCPMIPENLPFRVIRVNSEDEVLASPRQQPFGWPRRL